MVCFIKRDSELCVLFPQMLLHKKFLKKKGRERTDGTLYMRSHYTLIITYCIHIYGHIIYIFSHIVMIQYEQ